MKISCPSCQASYKIADEKVQGRTVKVRCRKCGELLHVNETGVMSTGASGPGPQEEASSSSDEKMYSVLVAEGDQREMTLQQVMDAYNTGVITGETFVWAEDMTDWQALGDVSAIVDALNSASVGDEPSVAPAQSASADPFAVFGAPAPQPEPSPVAPAAAFVPFPSPAAPRVATSTPVGGGMAGFGSPAASSPAPKPAAQPLFGKSNDAAVRDRGRDKIDLFGTRPATEEIATSAPVMPTRPGVQKKEDSSVLFSLSALTSSAGAESSRNSTPDRDDSGLIDLRAISNDAPPVEAAVPLAATGFMGASPLLGSPLLGPVGLDPATPDFQIPDPPKSSNKGLLIAAVVGVTGFVAMGIALVVVLMSSGNQVAPVASADQPTAATTPPPPATTEEPQVAAAPPATGVASTDSKPSGKVGGGGKKPPVGVGGGKPTAGGATPPDPPPTPTKKPPSNKCGCAPSDLACHMNCSVK